MSVTPITPPLFPNSRTLALEPPAPTWEELLPSYIDLSLEYACNPNDTKLRDRFEKQFRILRALKPTSFVPFYPIFLYHLTILDKDQLRELIKEGKECDAHLTFVFCLHSLTSESAAKRGQIIHIYHILLDAYPNDALLPAMLYTLVVGGDKFELELTGAAADLGRACSRLATNDLSRALLILMNECKRAPGQAMFQPWLALAWALKGNYSAAKIAFERMSTSLNPQFFSDYAQHILVSHIQFTGEQDFTKFNLVNTPYKRQIESFIALLEAKPFNAQLALKFIESSTNALESAPESLAFLYFGLQYMLDNMDSYAPELATIYRKIYDIAQSSIEFCYLSDLPDPWILENCAVNPTSMPLLQDARDIAAITPSFRFQQTFGITDASHRSLAAAIVNQSARLMAKIFEVSVDVKGLLLDLPLDLPPQKKLEEYCKSALLAENPTDFCTAITYLRHYLETAENARPFELSEEFLNRAKFLIFISAPPNNLEHKLDEQIHATYYPPKFQLSELLLIMKGVACRFSKADHSPILLAARDVLLAKIYTAKEGSDPYTLYLQSKQYFRWRPDESLDEWKLRLKTQACPSNPLFDLLHQFWKEFHQPQSKIQIPEAILAQIKMKMVPDGVTLRQVTVKCTKVYRKPAMPPPLHKPLNMVNEKLEVIAATLFTCAENQLDKPVTVKNQSQAEDLCRLVLETSVDRLIRKIFSMEESTNPDALRSLIRIHLSPLLGTVTYNQVNKCYRVPIATQSGIVQYRNIYVKGK